MASKEKKKDDDFGSVPDTVEDDFGSVADASTTPKKASTSDQLLRLLDISRAATGGPLLAKALGVYDPKKFQDAISLQGNFPSSEEMLQQAMPAKGPFGGAMQKGVGFALDALTDPLSFLSPTKPLVQALGKKSWKSAFKALDTEAFKQGKKLMPSDVLVEKGVAGSARSVSKQTADVAEALLDARDDILKEATEKGGKVDINKALSHAQTMAAEYRAKKIPGALEVADGIDEVIQGFDVLKGRATPVEASELKTFFYKSIPSGKWAKYANTSFDSELKKNVALGLKEGTEEAAEKAVGKGTEVAKLNEELGSLLSTRKKQLGEVSKEEIRPLFSSVDGLSLMGLGAAEADPRWWLIKKAADIAKMQGPRSLGGQFINQNPGLIDTGLRRSAWSLMKPEEQK